MNSSKTPWYQVVEGHMIAGGFNAENFKSALKYKAQDDDIFIATYPKSGTTWMQMIVLLLKNEGVIPNGLTFYQLTHDQIPFIDRYGASVVEQLDHPRMIKSHLPFNKIPWNDNAKYIVVCRNPFDVCVSFYHHTEGFTSVYNFKDGSFDVFFELFLKGEVQFGCYFYHLLSYWNQRTRKNILFLTYEEMKESVESAVKKVAEFLGGKYLENMKKEGVLDKILENISFSSMSKAINPTIKNRAEGSTNFIRKGVIGDYKCLFSKEQKRRLSDKFRQTCANSDAFELWRKYGLPTEGIESMNQRL